MWPWVSNPGQLKQLKSFTGTAKASHQRLRFPAEKHEFYKCPKKPRNLWILTCVWISRFCQIPAFAAGLELLILPYTIMVPAGTPGAVAWLGPNNHPAVWARRTHIKHKLFHCLYAYGYIYTTPCWLALCKGNFCPNTAKTFAHTWT